MPPVNMKHSIREIVLLILQFLHEEEFEETARMLEKESGFFFDMKYLEDCVLAGEWEELERYLFGFIKVDKEDDSSMRIFFHIRAHKYLEALDNQDWSKAGQIIMRDLKVFASLGTGHLFTKFTSLLAMENFREDGILSKYVDSDTARPVLVAQLKELIAGCPHFDGKLTFPPLMDARLSCLINQSLRWQHRLCKHPQATPYLPTLLHDHSCPGPGGGPRVPSPLPPAVNTAPKPATLSRQSAHSPPPTSLGLIPNAPIMAPVIQSAPPDSADHLNRRSSVGSSDEVVKLGTHFPKGNTGIAWNQHSPDELPKILARILYQASSVMSMDFHPILSTTLLVGTNVGDITVWEVAMGNELAGERFNVWDHSACSVLFQSAMAEDSVVSANRVVWNHNGGQVGVAYSKHLVHLYNYDGGVLAHCLEIEAHVGGVNDLAFSQANKQLRLITCGDDKTVKVWDAISGLIQATFEGHEAPVYSICPLSKQNIHLFFSISLDGKIKVWLYESGEAVINYSTPGDGCTTMAYSADGTRLFSCGTSKEGETYIVEWYESEGSIIRQYGGIQKRSMDAVQFDVTKNRFIAAGDDFLVKFWDMDNTNLLTTTNAEGGLPASPRVRFSKCGSFLAVSTNNKCIKILANADGFQLMGVINNLFYNATIQAIEADTKKNAETQSLVDVEPIIIEESPAKSKAWMLTEISEPSQVCSLRLPESLVAKVSRLLYTNSGVAILALASNGVHKMWKWQDSRNATGRATACVPPQIIATHLVMTSEMSDAHREAGVHCLALKKNDSYIMSASGGRVSLFNLTTFQTVNTFMAPPPAPTFIAFHPHDASIAAIGMADSCIQIYDTQKSEVLCRMGGHQKRVTCLAFSKSLNLMVSSGADAQLCAWQMNGWEKIASTFLQIPAGRSSASLAAETWVQFHNDQIQILVVHETQLAIHEATRLECLKRWVPEDGLITSAVYSCDSQIVYASFVDGSVSVLTAALQLRCRIKPSAYLNTGPSPDASPIVVAANPFEPHQFALGLTDGGVLVIEPSESEGEWGTAPPPETGDGVNAAGSSQAAAR